jgi:hypothetical protein
VADQVAGDGKPKTGSNSDDIVVNRDAIDRAVGSLPSSLPSTEIDLGIPPLTGAGDGTTAQPTVENGAGSPQVSSPAGNASAGVNTVVSASAPSSALPVGYKVVGSDKASIDKFVAGIVVARDHLDPQSDAFSKLDGVLTLLNQKGSNAITLRGTPIAHKQTSAQALVGRVVEIDVSKITKLAGSLMSWNQGSSYDDVFVAVGASTISHEIKHEADFIRLWNGGYPPNRGEEFRTEVNAYTTDMGVYKGLNLNYPPVYTPLMTDAQIHAQILKNATASTNVAYPNGK